MWRQFGAVDPDLNYIYWSPTNINPVFSINMARNADPNMEAALHQGPPVAGPGRPGRRLPGGGQADGLGASPTCGRVRTVWSVGAQPKVENFNNPTDPAGGPAFGMITGADLAHPDLAQLLTAGAARDRAEATRVGRAMIWP